LENTVNLG